jgi:hypothetical protein
MFCLKYCLSNAVNKVGEGASFEELINLQRDKDMTHVKALSSMTSPPDHVFPVYNVDLEGYMIRKVRLHISSIKIYSEMAGSICRYDHG